MSLTHLRHRGGLHQRGLSLQEMLVVIAVFSVLALIFIFFVPYMFAVIGPADRKSSIWQVWSEDRLLKEPAQEASRRITVTGYRVPLWALYFSLLSAVHIGWRDLHVGNWIARMQPKEFTLRATGWVRVVSGIQSLIGVYLIALWALTYFGRPFE